MQPSFARILADLSRPEAYTHHVERVTVLQTHISAVFLTGEFAYKVKKPVDFGFLDYSTPDLRTDLGTAYKNLGDREKALSEYGLAQRQDPFHQNSLFNQAIVHAELHDKPKALAAAREYLRRFPQGHGADSARTLISEIEGDGADVEKKLSEFLTAPKPVKAGP